MPANTTLLAPTAITLTPVVPERDGEEDGNPEWALYMYYCARDEMLGRDMCQSRIRFGREPEGLTFA